MKRALLLLALMLLAVPAAATEQETTLIRAYVGCVVLNATAMAKGPDSADLIARSAETMCKESLRAYMATQPRDNLDYLLATIRATERQAIMAATVEVIRQRGK